MAEINRVAMNMIRGDTLCVGLQTLTLTEDLDEVYFSCKVKRGDSTYVFQETLTGGGVTKVDTGLYQARVAPSKTRNLEPGIYWVDVECHYGADVYTALLGTLQIEYGVTE